MADVTSERIAPVESEDKGDAIAGAAAAAYAPPATPEVAVGTPTEQSPIPSQPKGDQGSSDSNSVSAETSTEQNEAGTERTPEQIQEEGEKAAKKLLEDAANGKWTDESVKIWEKVFKELSSLPGATAQSVMAALNAIGAAMNEQLARTGSPNRVGMAVQQSPDGTTSFVITLKGPNVNPADRLETLLTGNRTDSAIKIGTMKG